MHPSMYGRDFLKMLDLTPDEIRHLVRLAASFKEMKRAHQPHRYLEGRNIVLLFEKTSTRTRCSFEVAGRDLGMGVVYVDGSSSQMGKKESIPDTARVLSRMFDGIEYRGYGQEIVEELAEYADCPVWNGLTTESHPTQMIADLLTMQENFGRDLSGLRFVFMGDAQNNVGNSLMVTCVKMGMHFVACGPEKQMPDPALVEKCRQIAAETGGSVTLTPDVAEACTGAHVVYTDVWVSMGEPAEIWGERIELLSPYAVTQEVMDMTAENSIFLHCLPAYHDLKTGVGKDVYEKFGKKELEVTDEVFEGPKSKVFDEAENRMHAIKAIMYATLSPVQ
ncbi:MAG: ornithine carbamoyltransferase [Eggerthellales bacterium]|nr:ornithine carbamoyltransferase [Eggerthellales bacterium]